MWQHKRTKQRFQEIAAIEAATAFARMPVNEHCDDGWLTLEGRFKVSDKSYLYFLTILIVKKRLPQGPRLTVADEGECIPVPHEYGLLFDRTRIPSVPQRHGIKKRWDRFLQSLTSVSCLRPTS